MLAGRFRSCIAQHACGQRAPVPSETPLARITGPCSDAFLLYAPVTIYIMDLHSRQTLSRCASASNSAIAPVRPQFKRFAAYKTQNVHSNSQSAYLLGCVQFYVQGEGGVICFLLLPVTHREKVSIGR